MKHKMWKGCIVAGLCIGLSSVILGAGIMQEPKVLVLNDKPIQAIKELPVVEGQVLYPIEELSYLMGAIDVSWYPNKKVLTVENPSFYEQGLYLSYLAGLDQQSDPEDYPLPDRLQKLPLPPYPRDSMTPVSLHEAPIGLTIMDKKYMMPWAVYDYEWIDDVLYVSQEWFNVMFLAQTEYEGEKIIMTYPTAKQIEQNVGKLEQVTRPRTPEEAVALWIHGQQVRSGALQYSALGSDLQKQVWEQQKGWVTGGSSPSVGKATTVHTEYVKEDMRRYTITLEEVLQGKVNSMLAQTLIIRSYKIDDQMYWGITQAEGDLGYSILG